MIKISLDEAYALDMLAIALVKSRKSPGIKNYENYFSLANEIKDQMPMRKFLDVTNSPEFENLVNANNEVFDAVDLAKTDAIPASAVDQLNFRRYLCKKAIQEKFFSGELKEQKIGY